MKTDDYRHKLRKLNSWDAFLRIESGLPGPRGNLELAQAVADEGDAELFNRYLEYDAAKAPTGCPDEFLAFCGVIGLGRLAAEGDVKLFKRLRGYATDSRWRMREGVAMALQRVGDKNMDVLLQEMVKWSRGSPLEKRAAGAALCEPRLLQDKRHAEKVLRILDQITDSIRAIEDRKRDDFIALKKGLAYCWSVAVVAHPANGKARMEKWFRTDDPDIRWVMRENLKKNRLIRMDPTWVTLWQKAMAK